jgi:CubicO group peptidase (beta-lactamase class C family)
MKRITRALFAGALLSAAIGSPGDAQTPAVALDARASDPVRMGWMTGSPPPSDKLVRFADDSWAKFPQSRWAFSHVRELMPTTVVARGDGPIAQLPRAERTDIDGLTFRPIGRDSTMTFAESLEANYTDGILILHRGSIVYERYFGALKPERQHLAFSVTKSFVGTLAAMLIEEGSLDADAAVAQYLPELGKSAFGDATIRQLLDMTTGLAYTEDYNDPQSPVWELTRAGGFRVRPPGDTGPKSFFEYLRTVTKKGAHGEVFVYKTPNTDTLAAVLRRVTGKSLSALLHERIFGHLGAEHDAYFTVDETGAEFAGGGLNLTLRDLARFGETMRLAGRFNGQQIVPRRVVEDIERGASREQFAPAGYATLPGWSYRNMWWVSHNEHRAYTARGIHGQAIYVDPVAEMVIVRFASHHVAGNIGIDPTSLPAYEAVARLLMASR